MDGGGAASRRGRCATSAHAAANSALRIGLPLVAAGDVHMHVRNRRALQDTLTAIRHGCTVARGGPRTVPERRAPPAHAPAAGGDLSAEVAARRRCASPSAARFALGELKYEYPRELVPAGAHADAAICASSPRTACAGAGRTACRTRCAQLIEHELALIARAAVRAFLPDRARHRASSRAQRGHPVPGPRLGGQLGGVLLPAASPRSIRSRIDTAVRALHLARSATSRRTSTSTSSTSGARK